VYKCAEKLLFLNIYGQIKPKNENLFSPVNDANNTARRANP